MILHDVYADFMETWLGIPILRGRKTKRERFAGATNTMTVEAMMGDGKALQMGTSHELGQNFARVFDMKYLAETGTQELCWTTSWGVSTRMVGGLIMCHGDDAGLRMPPAVAPHQVVVLLVKDEGGAGETAHKLHDALLAAGIRSKLDDRVDTSFGRRAVDWELKGVPVRLEVGPRDLAEGHVGIMRRDTGEKELLGVDAAVARAIALLDNVQQSLFDAAVARREARTTDVATIEEAAEAAKDGFARIPWSALGTAGEAKLAESAVTVRCLQRRDGSIPDSEDEPDLVAFVARSY
jgi:prolyl-tRNA synthetase